MNSRNAVWKKATALTEVSKQISNAPSQLPFSVLIRGLYRLQ